MSTNVFIKKYICAAYRIKKRGGFISIGKKILNNGRYVFPTGIIYIDPLAVMLNGKMHKEDLHLDILNNFSISEKDLDILSLSSRGYNCIGASSTKYEKDLINLGMAMHCKSLGGFNVKAHEYLSGIGAIKDCPKLLKLIVGREL